MEPALSRSPSIARVGRNVVDNLVALVGERGLRPGDRLPPEVELARTLGVGRSKLREALTAWQRMGIVSRNKCAGTVLSAPIGGRTLALPLAVTLEMESMLRTLAVRRPLEIEAVRLAARHATPLGSYTAPGGGFDLVDSFLMIATGPGLGIEVDEAAVEAAARVGHRWRAPV